MASKNLIQLMISLGVDDASSRQNINNYISKLKNLDNVKVTLDVDGARATKGISDTEEQIKKLKAEVKDLQQQLKGATNVNTSQTVRQLQTVQREIVSIRRSAEGLTGTFVEMGNALKTAFIKFPIWMLASTAFYGTVAGIRSVTEQVIELDAALVGIERVADGFTYQFDELVTRSVANVNEVGGELATYLELLNEFARTGKTIEESYDLAGTATVLTNISDLDAKKSMDALTAAQINFNIASEDSMRIADKLNEIDNQYSITTLDLAQSMNKAASTSRTFGISLDELLSHTTAIGEATRESG